MISKNRCWAVQIPLWPKFFQVTLPLFPQMSPESLKDYNEKSDIRKFFWILILEKMGGRNRLPGKKLLKIEVEPTKEGNRTVTIAVEVIYLYF